MWGVRLMNSMKFSKTILFDLDGVILDTESIYLKIMLEYNKKINIPISRDYYISNFLGKTRNEIDAILKEKFKNKYNSKTYWNELLNNRKKYLSSNQIKIKPGFTELKDYLINNKYGIGIVTSNSRRLTMQLLEKAGLNADEFNVIITRDEVLNPKPAPDLYLKTVESLKAEKKEFIAIEDSNVGIQAAINARIPVIHLNDIDEINLDLKRKCVKSISSLIEVINIIRR